MLEILKSVSLIGTLTRPGTILLKKKGVKLRSDTGGRTRCIHCKFATTRHSKESFNHIVSVIKEENSKTKAHKNKIKIKIK